MLKQIDDAAKRHEAPVKIWLVDLFSLIFLIQLPLTYVSQWQTEVEISVVILMVVLFSAIMTLVWWTTIKTVSRAGITMVLWRSAISLVVIPMAYVGSFAIMAVAISLLNGGKPIFGQRMSPWIVESVLVALMAGSMLIVKRAVFVADETQKPIPTERPVVPLAGGRQIDWDD